MVKLGSQLQTNSLRLKSYGEGISVETVTALYIAVGSPIIARPPKLRTWHVNQISNNSLQLPMLSSNMLYLQECGKQGSSLVSVLASGAVLGSNPAGCEKISVVGTGEHASLHVICRDAINTVHLYVICHMYDC